MEAIDIILWIGGISISIILALLGAKKVFRVVKQNQRARDNAIAIQAGRDIKSNDK